MKIALEINATCPKWILLYIAGAYSQLYHSFYMGLNIKLCLPLKQCGTLLPVDLLGTSLGALYWVFFIWHSICFSQPLYGVGINPFWVGLSYVSIGCICLGVLSAHECRHINVDGRSIRDNAWLQPRLSAVRTQSETGSGLCCNLLYHFGGAQRL